MHNALIIEDLSDAAAWLQQALHHSFPQVHTHTVSSVATALHYLSTTTVLDLALVDLGLPDGSGITILEQLRKTHPQTICIVTSIFADDQHVFPALKAGAAGYLLKDQPQEHIVQALQGMAAGKPPLSPAIARRMMAYFQQSSTVTYPALTQRENDVLQMIGKGFTQSECARLLGLSPNTITGYVKDIYRKLNISSRAEAALIAKDLGLV